MHEPIMSELVYGGSVYVLSLPPIAEMKIWHGDNYSSSVQYVMTVSGLQFLKELNYVV